MRTRSTILLIISLAVIGSGCNSEEEVKSSSPIQIHDLHKDITGIYKADKDNATEIVIRKSKILNTESVVFSLASDALRITAGMQENSLFPASERIRFTIAVPLQDKYGNSNIERVISLTFLRSELQKVNASNAELLPQQFLNLYEKYWIVHPTGEELLRGFCLAEIGKPAREFCKAVLV